MQIKKVFIPFLLGSIIICGGGGLTSCNKLKSFSVNWRTEDLEWTAGNPLMDREWVWITPPIVYVSDYGLDDGSMLPDGIVLNPNGQLVGTPTKACELDVKFTCVANDYKTQVSKPVHFIIYPKGTNAPDVDWTGDIWLQRNVDLNPTDPQTKCYKSNPSVSGGKFRLRQSYSLPSGLSFDGDTGVLSGKPTATSRWLISYEYYSPTNAFEENVSPVYRINICYKHNLSININKNNRWTVDNLTTSIKSVDKTLYNSFDVLDLYLQINYSGTKYLEAIGNLADHLFNPGRVYPITGIKASAPHSTEVQLSFADGQDPGYQLTFLADDFKGITDTIAP